MHCTNAFIGSSVDRCIRKTRCCSAFQDSTHKGLKRNNHYELKQKCDELLKEIEERKRLHSELRSKLFTIEDPFSKSEEPFQLQPETSCNAHFISQKEDLLHEQEVLNIVMVGAECEPYSKTGDRPNLPFEDLLALGGLADVMGSLPKFLSALGHRVMVVIPFYHRYADAKFTGVRMQYSVFGGSQEVAYYHEYRDGVDFVFVDHPCYHNRGIDLYSGDRLDVTFRCTLLCKSALEAPWHVPCGGIVYGDSSLVFIANDWHAALVPVYLQAHYQDHGKLSYARSVFVIHNIAFQGRGPLSELELFEVPLSYYQSFMLDDPFGGEHMNLMKAALIHSHRIVAVSHGYAWECQTQEGGWGLDSVLRDQSWKLSGIINGIDQEVWNSETDLFLQSDGYVNYSLNTLSKKSKCKEALQREMGLTVDSSIPLLGFIGRLDYQKGVDLIRDCFDWLMDQDVQLIMLGLGRPDLEESLREMENTRTDQCRSWVGFSSKMAHRITAGCDILLMPSRYEPCGLNQLYAMSYGTVPVVHAVGGLRDTVHPFNPYENTGTGFTFDWMYQESIKEAIGNALNTYNNFPDSFHSLQKQGMEQNYGWEEVAHKYSNILKSAKYQW